MSVVERATFFAANIMVLVVGAVILTEHHKVFTTVMSQAGAAFR
jgi:hypothetical protein